MASHHMNQLKNVYDPTTTGIAAQTNDTAQRSADERESVGSKPTKQPVSLARRVANKQVYKDGFALLEEELASYSPAPEDKWSLVFWAVIPAGGGKSTLIQKERAVPLVDVDRWYSDGCVKGRMRELRREDTPESRAELQRLAFAAVRVRVAELTEPTIVMVHDYDFLKLGGKCIFSACLPAEEVLAVCAEQPRTGDWAVATAKNNNQLRNAGTLQRTRAEIATGMEAVVQWVQRVRDTRKGELKPLALQGRNTQLPRARVYQPLAGVGWPNLTQARWFTYGDICMSTNTGDDLDLFVIRIDQLIGRVSGFEAKYFTVTLSTPQVPQRFGLRAFLAADTSLTGDTWRMDRVDFLLHDSGSIGATEAENDLFTHNQTRPLDDAPVDICTTKGWQTNAVTGCFSVAGLENSDHLVIAWDSGLSGTGLWEGWCTIRGTQDEIWPSSSGGGVSDVNIVALAGQPLPSVTTVDDATVSVLPMSMAAIAEEPVSFVLQAGKAVLGVLDTSSNNVNVTGVAPGVSIAVNNTVATTVTNTVDTNLKAVASNVIPAGALPSGYNASYGVPVTLLHPTTDVFGSTDTGHMNAASPASGPATVVTIDTGLQNAIYGPVWTTDTREPPPPMVTSTLNTCINQCTLPAGSRTLGDDSYSPMSVLGIFMSLERGGSPLAVAQEVETYFMSRLYAYHRNGGTVRRLASNAQSWAANGLREMCAVHRLMPDVVLAAGRHMVWAQAYTPPVVHRGDFDRSSTMGGVDPGPMTIYDDEGNAWNPSDAEYSLVIRALHRRFKWSQTMGQTTLGEKDVAPYREALRNSAAREEKWGRESLALMAAIAAEPVEADRACFMNTLLGSDQEVVDVEMIPLPAGFDPEADDTDQQNSEPKILANQVCGSTPARTDTGQLSRPKGKAQRPRPSDDKSKEDYVQAGKRRKQAARRYAKKIKDVDTLYAYVAGLNDSPAFMFDVLKEVENTIPVVLETPTGQYLLGVANFLDTGKIFANMTPVSVGVREVMTNMGVRRYVEGYFSKLYRAKHQSKAQMSCGQESSNVDGAAEVEQAQRNKKLYSANGNDGCCMMFWAMILFMAVYCDGADRAKQRCANRKAHSLNGNIDAPAKMDANLYSVPLDMAAVRNCKELSLLMESATPDGGREIDPIALRNQSSAAYNGSGVQNSRALYGSVSMTYNAIGAGGVPNVTQRSQPPPLSHLIPLQVRTPVAGALLQLQSCNLVVSSLQLSDQSGPSAPTALASALLEAVEKPTGVRVNLLDVNGFLMDDMYRLTTATENRTGDTVLAMFFKAVQLMMQLSWIGGEFNRFPLGMAPTYWDWRTLLANPIGLAYGNYLDGAGDNQNLACLSVLNPYGPGSGQFVVNPWNPEMPILIGDPATNNRGQTGMSVHINLSTMKQNSPTIAFTPYILKIGGDQGVRGNWAVPVMLSMYVPAPFFFALLELATTDVAGANALNIEYLTQTTFVPGFEEFELLMPHDVSEAKTPTTGPQAAARIWAQVTYGPTPVHVIDRAGVYRLTQPYEIVPVCFAGAGGYITIGIFPFLASWYTQGVAGCITSVQQGVLLNALARITGRTHDRATAVELVSALSWVNQRPWVGRTGFNDTADQGLGIRYDAFGYNGQKLRRNGAPFPHLPPIDEDLVLPMTNTESLNLVILGLRTWQPERVSYSVPSILDAPDMMSLSSYVATMYFLAWDAVFTAVGVPAGMWNEISTNRYLPNVTNAMRKFFPQLVDQLNGKTLLSSEYAYILGGMMRNLTGYKPHTDAAGLTLFDRSLRRGTFLEPIMVEPGIPQPLEGSWLVVPQSLSQLWKTIYMINVPLAWAPKVGPLRQVTFFTSEELRVDVFNNGVTLVPELMNSMPNVLGTNEVPSSNDQILWNKELIWQTYNATATFVDVRGNALVNALARNQVLIYTRYVAGDFTQTTPNQPNGHWSTTVGWIPRVQRDGRMIYMAIDAAAGNQLQRETAGLDYVNPSEWVFRGGRATPARFVGTGKTTAFGWGKTKAAIIDPPVSEGAKLPPAAVQIEARLSAPMLGQAGL